MASSAFAVNNNARLELDPHYLAFLATLNEPAPKPADVIPTTKAACKRHTLLPTGRR